MAPDGHCSATAMRRSASTVSGYIHVPGVLALKTVGACSTQKRAWIQRLPSNRIVMSRPTASSTATGGGGGGCALSGSVVADTAVVAPAIDRAPGALTAVVRDDAIRARSVGIPIRPAWLPAIADAAFAISSARSPIIGNRRGSETGVIERGSVNVSPAVGVGPSVVAGKRGHLSEMGAIACMRLIAVS